MFDVASKRRATGSHLMNSQSSRSHFCCIFNIRKVLLAGGQKTSSKIHLIDLAGSEMVSMDVEKLRVKIWQVLIGVSLLFVGEENFSSRQSIK